MLKIAKKWPNFALGGQFWLQSDFFRKVPPIRLRSDGDQKFWVPPIKNLEEKPWVIYVENAANLQSRAGRDFFGSLQPIWFNNIFS